MRWRISIGSFRRSKCGAKGKVQPNHTFLCYTAPMDNHNPVVHFEMPYEDRERVKKFYEQAFGWGMNQMGEEMGNYVVAHTADTDDKNMVKNPGQINGGFFQKSADNGYPSVVVAVKDIKEAIEKVKAAGGQVPGEPVEIPGIGTYAAFIDTEGNRASILQPDPRM